MACLQIYRELLFLTTFLQVHSNSKGVSYLSWQNTYRNPKATCHIKLKLFLWTKLLDNLLLAKYLISVTAPLKLILKQNLNKMDVRIRNSEWQSDGELQRELSKYVAKGLQRNEILSYMLWDFPQYSWRVRTLDRRMRYFNIFCHNKNVSLNAVEEAVRGELNGPGKLLGYRAMHLKIRQKNGLNVTRDQVYDVMADVDLEGLTQRQRRFKQKKQKGTFTEVGPNWIYLWTVTINSFASIRVLPR